MILGPVGVSAGRRLVDLGGPKQRAVLALLLVHANRIVTLDRLIDALWGDAPPARATATLQVFISNLRRSLEPDRAPRAPPTILLTRPPGYLLSLAPGDLDADRFEAQAEKGRRLLLEGNPSAAHTTLSAALSLWNGPALGEFAGESFAQAEANRLEGLRMLAVEDRVQAELDLGRHQLATTELESLIAEHPLHERLWAMLMLAEYRAGRQAEALRTYQRARLQLGEELGIEPGPALQRLEHDILEQSPAIEWHPNEGASPAPDRPSRRDAAAQPDEWTVGASGSVFVGRRDELRRLDHCVASVMAGRGGVVLLSGETGIGKTRLAHELAARVSAAGAATAWGRCFEGEAPPFWPWMQVLRALRSTTDRRELTTWEVSALAQLLPELRTNGTPPPLSAEPTEARFQLCSALADVVIGLAERRPLCIVIDDLHWVDLPSLQLLSVLAGRVEDAHLLVAATVRDGEMGDDSARLTEALGTLEREPVTTRIALAGLAEHEVAAFVASVIGREPSPSLTGVLHDRTDGNPFFLVELIRLLESEGGLAGADDHRLPDRVPPGVRHVIRRRLARLPGQTNALLSIAAVAGTEFDHRLLEMIGGLDEERTLELMEVALVTGIVVDSADTVGRYRFSHPLVRQTVYESLSAVRRARLHARVAGALRSVRGDEAVVDIARHLWSAGGEVEADEVLAAVLRAAEATLGLLAYEQAAEQLRRAGELLRRREGDAEAAGQELVVQLRLAQLLAMTRGSGTPETEQALARAQALTEFVGHEPDLLPALWGLFFAQQLRCETGLGRRLGERFLVSAERNGDCLFELAGHLALATTAYLDGNLADAALAFGRATALADGLPSRTLAPIFQMDPACFARSMHAHVLALQGCPESAEVLARKAIARADSLGDPLASTIAHILSGVCAVLRGDVAEVERAVRTAAPIAAATGFRGMEAMATGLEAWALGHRGQAVAAADKARRGLAMLDATGNVWGRALSVAAWAAVEQDPAQKPDVLARVEDLLSATEAGGERYYEAECHRLRAELLVAVCPARLPEAIESATTAVAVARRQGAQALEARGTSTLTALTRL